MGLMNDGRRREELQCTNPSFISSQDHMGYLILLSSAVLAAVVYSIIWVLGLIFSVLFCSEMSHDAATDQALTDQTRLSLFPLHQFDQYITKMWSSYNEKIRNTQPM